MLFYRYSLLIVRIDINPNENKHVYRVQLFAKIGEIGSSIGIQLDSIALAIATMQIEPTTSCKAVSKGPAPDEGSYPQRFNK